MSSYILFNWNRVSKACTAIANSLQWQHIDGIIAISRWGLVPATCISHILSVPVVGVVFAKSYDSSDLQCTIKTDCNVGELVGSYLLVDDICDTGVTMSTCKNKLESEGCKITTASLVLKSGANFTPDAIGVTIRWKNWVKFCWEYSF